MLCYQSRRSAIDIIHDAIKWLTDNRRMMFGVLLLILPAIIYTISMGMPSEFYDDRWYNSFFEKIFSTISQMFSFIAVDDTQTRLLAFGPLAFCLGMVLSSQLSRYFYHRHPVKDANPRSILRSLGHSTWRWVLCGLAAALVTLFSNFFLVVLMLIVGGYIIPPLIMHTSYSSDDFPNMWMKIKTLFFVILIITVVLLLPMFMGGLIFAALKWFNRIMPIMSNNDTINFVANIIIYVGVLISYCFGIAIWITTMILQYGSNSSDEN